MECLKTLSPGKARRHTQLAHTEFVGCDKAVRYTNFESGSTAITFTSPDTEKIFVGTNGEVDSTATLSC